MLHTLDNNVIIYLYFENYKVLSPNSYGGILNMIMGIKGGYKLG
jgi:hypothetical protein